MKQWHGLSLPDSEEHLIQWMSDVGHTRDGIPTYQYSKYERALAKVPRGRRRVAVDVGSNIGLWSMWMALDFDDLFCFEPVKEYRECLYQNLTLVNATGAKILPYALGAERKKVHMVATTPGSNGDTEVRVAAFDDAVKTTSAHMRTLDSGDFNTLDFLKIDCEGYELNVLKGAEETIARCRPVIIVEQKPGNGSKYGYRDDAAVDWLEDRGYRLDKVLAGDYIMVPL
jgi:FkbM family methyltransferase